jgi:hypothetical protein
VRYQSVMDDHGLEPSSSEPPESVTRLEDSCHEEVNSSISMTDVEDVLQNSAPQSASIL